MQTESHLPESANLDEMTTLDIVRLMNREDQKVPGAVAAQEQAICQAIDLITDRLRAGGRLIYIGAGTSGRLGVLDAAECPPTFQSPPEQVIGIIAGGYSALTRAVEGAEDHDEQPIHDLQAINLTAKDIIVGIATSGRTPYVLHAVEYARSIGVYTVGITCNSDSALEDVVDLAITPVVGPEILSGSTRLKAGTATKLILNMLTTASMVKLGKTHGHLMVDLKASNQKLRERARRIVKYLTHLNDEDVTRLLTDCNGEVKTAVVAHKSGVSAKDARQQLQLAGGHLRRALAVQTVNHRSVGSNLELILGIDGGGTSTEVLLADRTNGTILGRGQAGPSNVKTVGWEYACQAVLQSIDAAFHQAGKARVRVGAAVLGLAGAGQPAIAGKWRNWALNHAFAEQIEVTTDASLVLVAGTPQGWGIGIIAGTGSIVWGKNQKDQMERAGGWGYLWGDHGSAYRLVIEALQAIARTADGLAAPTLLTQSFLKHLSLVEPQQLVSELYQSKWNRVSLSELAPLVMDVASRGDTVAARIVQDQACELARSAKTIADKLNLKTQETPLCMAGGVLAGSEYYRLTLMNLLETQGFVRKKMVLVHEPADGAVKLAKQMPVLRIEH